MDNHRHHYHPALGGCGRELVCSMKPAFGEVRCDACSEWADACGRICETYSCRDEGHWRDREAEGEIDR